MLDRLTNCVGKNQLLYSVTALSITILALSILFIFGTPAYNNYQVGKENYHLQLAFAQPASDYPIPDAQRMFTNDTATIKRFVLQLYLFDVA